MNYYPLTLGQLRSEIFDVVNTCADDEELITMVNRANQMIHLEDCFTVQQDRICLNVCDGQVSVPYQYESLNSAQACGDPVTIRNRHFEFLFSGPGRIDNSGCEVELHDRGFSPVFKNPSTPRRVFFVSDRAEDTGTNVGIRYVDGNGKEFFHGGFDVENLPLVGSSADDPQSPKMTSRYVSKVISISKPVTKGYVYLFACDDDGSNQDLIARFHPRELNPFFKIYEVSGCAKQITAMAKRKLSVVAHDDDVLPVGLSVIYRHYIRALRLYDSDNIQDHDVASRTKKEAQKMLHMYMSQGSGIHAGQLNYSRHGSPADLTDSEY